MNPPSKKNGFEMQVETLLESRSPLLKKGISLQPFQPKESALLTPLKKKDVEIQMIPGTTGSEAKPTLLLHDLANDQHKEKDVYDYIEKNRKKSVTVLYGTSGAGKTHSALEYLSLNKGTYLTATTRNNRDPGSEDLDVDMVLGGLLTLSRFNDDDETKKAKAKGNFQRVLLKLRAILHIRKAIHDRLERDFITEETVDDRIVGRQKPDWKAIVVDESQQLQRNGHENFMSSDGKETCSAYSAVLKAFLVIKKEASPSIPFPTFSGTSISKENMDVSAVAKQAMEDIASFDEFRPLDEQEVERYLETFLDLTNIRNAVKKHIARWLVGRPRWAANYMEEFLYRSLKSPPGGTRGKAFTDHEKRVVEAIDRYIDYMTKSPGERRLSCTGNTTAYTSIDRFISRQKGLGTPGQALRQAKYKYAVGGQTTLVSKHVAELVEVGVAGLCTNQNSPEGTIYQVVIGEPIVVQAGAEFFGLEDMTTWSLDLQENASAQGFAFEKCSLVPIRTKLEALVKNEFTEKLDGFVISQKSSYGVFAQICESSSDVMKWIHNAVDAELEGAVPPFCMPDVYMGPDVLTLMWNAGYTEFVSSFVQIKYEKKTKQAQAVGTLVPALFYVCKRGTNDESSPFKKDTNKQQKWETAKFASW